MDTLLCRLRSLFSRRKRGRAIKIESDAENWLELARDLREHFAEACHQYPEGSGWHVDIIANSHRLSPRHSPGFDAICFWLGASGLGYAVHLTDDLPPEAGHRIVLRHR